LRTREFGIRMALGADSSRVLALVMCRGAVVVASGLAFGIAGAAALTRVLGTLLYGVGASDPATFVSTAALLAAVALLACVIPAARAARVDPAVALRVE
jgi:putative ABC transport system permease protein